MSGDSANYDVGYPIYGAKFINESTLLVAGGGGQFNSSFPNKITALRVNFQKKKQIRRFREITLDSIDDAPTSLDCNNNLILVGCNEVFNDPSMENVNHHLRKFVFEQEHLKFVASIDFNRTTDPSVFTKFIYVNQRATVAAIASSEVPTVIRIIDPRNLTENYEIETGREVNDLHFAPNGILLSYITSNSLEVASVRDGKFVARKTDFDKNLVLSNIRFLNDNTLLVAASLTNSDGVSLLKLGVSSKGVKILKTASFMFDLNGITSMDVSPNKKFVGLSSNDNSIAIISVEKLKLMQLVPRVHESTITRVTFSPDSRYLASTSMGNTVNVVKFSSASSSILRKIWKFFLNFVLLVILASAIQLGYKYNVHGFIYEHAHDLYRSKFQEDTAVDQGSSSYFTINDDYRGITESADIISAKDLTRDIDTEFSTFETSTMKTITEGEQGSVWISSSPVAQFTSTGDPTSVFPSSSLSSSSIISEFFTKEQPTSSSFSEESTTNEPILSSFTSEVIKPLVSSTESNIVEKRFMQTNAESSEPRSFSSEYVTEHPEPIHDLREQSSSLIVDQSENKRTTDRDSVSEILSSESPSSSPSHSLSHMPSPSPSPSSSSSSSSSLSPSPLSSSSFSSLSSTTTSTTSALSTSTATSITATGTTSINDPSNVSFLDGSKIAHTREIYKTKIITEVITKIEYRDISASSSETAAEQYINTSSLMSLTPTNTMVSRPVTEIDPIASELEGMVETPTHPTFWASKIDSVAPNLIPNDEVLSISSSQDSILSHQDTYSDSLVTSSLQSMEIPTVSSSPFASGLISPAPSSTFSRCHSISKSGYSVIEESATSLFLKTETESASETAISTDNSDHIGVSTDAVQSSGANVGKPSPSGFTNIEETSLAPITFSSNDGSIGTLSDTGKESLSTEIASSTVAQPMPDVTISVPSFVSGQHEIPSSSVNTSSFVQKEIMIEVKASTDSSETSGAHRNINGNVNTLVSQVLATETHTSDYEEVTHDISPSNEVVSTLNIEITALPGAVTPSQTDTAPLNNNSNANIVNDNSPTAEPVNYANLHDEL